MTSSALASAASSPDPPRIPRGLALPLAQALAARLAPQCHEVAIVGSLRRGAADVADIDIVCVPHLRPHLDRDDAADPADAQWSDGFLDCLAPKIDLVHGWRLLRESDDIPYSGLFGAVQAEWDVASSIRARYRQARQIKFIAPLPPSMPRCPDASMPSRNIRAEVYCAAAANAGWIKVLRTGPGAFTHALVSYAAREFFDTDEFAVEFAAGCLWRRQRTTAMRSLVVVRTERDLFAALRLPYLRPEERTAQGLDIAITRRPSR